MFLYKLILSCKGTLLKSRDKSTILNCGVEGRDWTEGCYKENFISFLSRSMEAKSIVEYGTEWEASCDNISSLNFLFISSIIFPSSHLGFVSNVLPVEPRISTSVEMEVAFVWYPLIALGSLVGLGSSQSIWTQSPPFSAPKALLSWLGMHPPFRYLLPHQYPSSKNFSLCLVSQLPSLYWWAMN